MSKRVIVLVMHGMPPGDFPKNEMAEYFRLYNPFHHEASHGGHGGQQDHKHDEGLKRFMELDTKMRNWPRDPEKDQFYRGAYQLAQKMESASGAKVLVGFNEFCAPDLHETLDQAASEKPETVVVVTPMMMPGGIHSEVEIPELIKSATERHPGVRFEYVWPYDLGTVAGFLNGQITSYLQERTLAPRS